MSRLVLDGIEKRFGDERVLEGVALDIAAGEIVALLGPSGSGKTTLLRILAGFESADAGTVTLGGERVDRLPPERRGFGMVFQHYALFPHLTVGGNVAFGLETKKLGKAEITARVTAALARVDLSGFEPRRVGELSGGQQQRVALARALAPEPRVLLLDEPLSNLDPSLRERTRRELAARLREVGVTCVLVTHEQEEAFELGERVALLHRGRLAQVGTPRELYRAPANGFVAGFVGRGSFLDVAVESVAPEPIVAAPRLPGGRTRAATTRPFAAGERGRLFLRPEMLELVAPDAADALAGEVLTARFAGASSTATIGVGDGVELEALAGDPPPERGARVGVRLRAGARPRLFDRESP